MYVQGERQGKQGNLVNEHRIRQGREDWVTTSEYTAYRILVLSHVHFSIFMHDETAIILVHGQQKSLQVGSEHGES